MRHRFFSVALLPGFSSDLQRSLKDLWKSVDGVNIDGACLLLAGHPALRWQVRVCKKELLEPLKIYGINDIKVRTS
ncbi:MAG: hypothetical protein HY547_03160 [Elusimicrobia bacterium]|nr:hypothetical protein [Elusimicrobiota bacterium]